MARSRDDDDDSYAALLAAHHARPVVRRRSSKAAARNRADVTPLPTFRPVRSQTFEAMVERQLAQSIALQQEALGQTRTSTMIDAPPTERAPTGGQPEGAADTHTSLTDVRESTQVIPRPFFPIPPPAPAPPYPLQQLHAQQHRPPMMTMTPTPKPTSWSSAEYSIVEHDDRFDPPISEETAYLMQSSPPPSGGVRSSSGNLLLLAVNIFLVAIAVMLIAIARPTLRELSLTPHPTMTAAPK